MDNNLLCGVYLRHGSPQGNYTAEGITALCEGLKQSSVNSLRCGACILNMCVIAVAVAHLTLWMSLHSLDGHPLAIDELRGTKPMESIDLSQKKLGVASAVIIASCISGNEHLRELK